MIYQKEDDFCICKKEQFTEEKCLICGKKFMRKMNYFEKVSKCPNHYEKIICLPVIMYLCSKCKKG